LLIACVILRVGVPEISAWRNGDLGVSHKHCLEAGARGPGVAYGVVEEQGEDMEYEDDNDDDYEGILKPAFVVDGDPDFESGEPLDGFEYLRHVRYPLHVVVSRTRISGEEK